MKNFNEFLNENLYSAAEDKISKREALKEDLLGMIENTIGSSDLIDLQNWIGDFENNDPNTFIDELVDDSNVYDFYLKHQDDIDEILNENNWFNNKMSDVNASGLYDVTIIGTNEGIKLTITELKEELF